METKKTIFVEKGNYEKDGKKVEFTLENLPDSTWTFVSAETVRKERHRPEESIVTLPVIDADGGYHDYLAATGNAMVVSVYAPGKLSLRKWKVVHDYLVSAGDNGFRPLLLVAASPEAGQEIKDTMAASGDCGNRRSIPDYDGTLCNRLGRIVWKRTWRELAEAW